MRNFPHVGNIIHIVFVHFSNPQFKTGECDMNNIFNENADNNSILIQLTLIQSRGGGITEFQQVFFCFCVILIFYLFSVNYY